MSHGKAQAPCEFTEVCDCGRSFVAHAPTQLECDPCRYDGRKGKR